MSALPSIPDAELLRQYARSRDGDAFARLVARHMRAVRHVAFRYVRHAQAAEDVAQATFLVLAQRPKPALRSARRKRSALPWLAKVCRYAAANWRRAESRRQRRERLVAQPSSHYDPTAGHELAEAVQSALACLPRRDRRIVEWRHLSQMPWDEVARHAGTTPDAARKARTRAVAHLRLVLEKRGITAGSAAVLAGLRALTIPTTSSAATATTIATTAPELAKGVLAVLKLQTATAITAAVLATGGLIATAAAFLQEDPPAARVRLAGGNLAARLSDGTTVTLLGIGDAGGNWWTPDGTRDVDFGEPPLGVWPRDGELMRKLTLRVRPLSDHKRDATYFTPGTAGIAVHYDGPAATADTFVAVTIDEAAEKFSLEVRIPVGEPIEIAQVPVEHLQMRSAEQDGFQLSFSPLGRREFNGSDHLFVTLFAEGELAGKRLWAELVTEGGERLQGSQLSSGRSAANVLTFNFPSDEALKEIEELIVTYAPLETVRFEKLAAQQGAVTKPAIEVLDRAATAAALRSEQAEVMPAVYRKPIGEPVVLDQVPLIDAIRLVSNRHRLTVSLDQTIETDTPVTVSVSPELNAIEMLEAIAQAANANLEVVWHNRRFVVRMQ